MMTQSFKALLCPLPIWQLVLLGPAGDLRVFLGIASKQPGTDQKEGPVDGVNQGLGVVQDQVMCEQAVA